MTDGADGTVLVTGSSGAIGGATAAAFLAGGWAVLGLDRAPSRITDPRYRHVLADARDADAVAQGLRDGLAGDGRLRHAILIAGGALPGEPETRDDPAAISTELFRASLEANLVADLVVIQAALPYLERAAPDDRSITLTSSFNALSAQGMPAYSAAKAGLIGMMHGLVRPLGARGIRINVIAPGTVRTPRTEALWAGSPGHFERLAEGTAMGRLSTPDDVAAAFLAVAGLVSMTGQVLLIDGGQSVIHR